MSTSFDDIQRRSRELFRVEAADLIAELEASLLALEQAPHSAPLIDRVFRAMHTLKGSGATSGFADLAAFLHHVEDVYNAARENRLTVTGELVDLTLRILDTVNRYLGAAASEASAVLAAAEETLAALRAVGSSIAPTPPKAPIAAGDGEVATNSAAAPTRWRVSFRPHTSIFQQGSDPGMFLDDLRALGPCRIQTNTERVPSLDELDAELCYLGWEIEVTTDAGHDAVKDVFAFVEDACDLAITPIESAAIEGDVKPALSTWCLRFVTTAASAAAPGALRNLWMQLEQLGTCRVRSAPQGEREKAIGAWELELTTSADAATIEDAFAFLPDAGLQLAERKTEVAIQEPTEAKKMEPAVQATAATATTTLNEQIAAAKHDVLRVSSDKLDRLVNLVGELVILRSQVSAACGVLPEVPPVLRGAAEGLDRLSAELRDLVLNVRMMPVGETFNKFKRLTRDMSRELGKEVDLVIEGESTEMDKSMLDQLNDPLVHVVRNCLDHGLEGPAAREAAGKPRRGCLRITAEQCGDRVLISVADDGRGLNTTAIREKAIAKGLIAPEASLSDAELHQLVFLPGFSTASKISQLSGRGVGMDVVRKRIEQMRGTVELRSRPGQGTEIRMSLPLTLAIIDGLMVGVEGERYILPLGMVREIIELPATMRADRARNVVPLRGALIPFLRLRDVFGLGPAPVNAVERVAVLELEGAPLGIAVDEVLGSHQTVLKSLGWLSRRIKIFSGATIIGDGRVALILDVPALVAHTARVRGTAAALEM